MFRFLALLFHDASPKTNRARLLLLSSMVGMFWCGSAWPQDGTAGLRLGSYAVSIQVVFDGQDHKTGQYRVLLKNVSSHAVTDVCIGESADGSNAVNGSRLGHAAITAGGTFPILMTADGGVFVQAALFDDGSYEGNAKQAAMMAAMKIGQLAQWERIKPRLDQIVATDDPDEYKMKMMRAELTKLPEESEQAMMTRLRKAYPTVPLVESVALSWLGVGLRNEKGSLIDQVDGGERYLAKKSPQFVGTLAQWWSQIEPLYEPYNSADK